MTVCYRCSNNLDGKWQTNKAGGSMGNNMNYSADLGVSAYFLNYKQQSLVYCFCKDCYKSGKMSTYLKDWLPEIYKNLQTQILEQLQIKNKEKLKKFQDKIASLQQMMNFYEEMFCKQDIHKLYKFEQQYHKLLKNLSNSKDQEFIRQRKQILNKNNLYFKSVIANILQSALTKLTEVKKLSLYDIEKIKKNKKLNLQSMKELKNQSNNNNIFRQEELKKVQEIFDRKVKQKQQQIKKITDCFEIGEKIKEECCIKN